MPESKQWADFRDVGGMGPNDQARNIVEWVNANGGEARYEPACDAPGCGARAVIVIRNRSGNALVSPGQWVVRGGWVTKRVHDRATDGRFTECLREFTVEDR